MAWCHVCDSDVPNEELLEHVRLLHPDQYGDGLEEWPDGSPVIVDETVETVDDALASGEDDLE